MGTMNVKRLLLILATLTLALTAAPAAAQYERENAFRPGHRVERVRHVRWEHWRWEHRHPRFAYRVPYAARNCHRRPGYRAWDGWRYVWVPSHIVCR